MNKGVVQVRGKDAPNKCMDLYKSPDKFMKSLQDDFPSELNLTFDIQF